MNNIRIGEGWDVHALVPGRKLILGGVEIAHSAGLLGHSDADVLLHAITDAVLGAAGLGDIGRHFPDTDAQFKGADSSLLLQEAMRRVSAAKRRCSRPSRPSGRRSSQPARSRCRRSSASSSLACLTFKTESISRLIVSSDMPSRLASSIFFCTSKTSI